MVHDMARITGTIGKIKDAQEDTWDILFEGKMTIPVHGPEERFSIVLNDKTRKKLSKGSHMVELKIKNLIVSDDGVNAISFEGGVWESKNLLFLGDMTFQLLANKLCADIMPGKSNDKEKAKSLNKVLGTKELYLEFRPKGVGASKNDFEGTPINIIIHD